MNYINWDIYKDDIIGIVLMLIQVLFGSQEMKT